MREQAGWGKGDVACECTPFQSAKDTGADCSSIGRYSPVAAPTGPSRG